MIRSTAAVLFCGLLLSIPAISQKVCKKAKPSGNGFVSQDQATKAPADKAQQPAATAPGQTGLKITVGTTEVILAVTVTDNKGRFVGNLEKQDFRVMDEGRQQELTYFYHDTPGVRQNTVIGFLVDMSNNSISHWDKFKEATKELIWQLLPNDRNYQGYLISYSSQAELAMNTTWEADKLTDRLDRMKPGGGAALYNAIHMACTDRALVPGEPYQPRRVVIIVGDGHDSASEYTLDNVVELANRNLVTVYGVSTVAFGSSSDDTANLERLAKATGGRVEYPLANPYRHISGYLSQASDYGNYAIGVGTGGYTAAIAGAINASVQSLQGEITTQYILRYRPNIDPATAYRDTRRVKIEIPGLPADSVKLLYRETYFSNPVRQ